MISAGPTIPRDAELLSALSGRWCVIGESGKDCSAFQIQFSEQRFTSCQSKETWIGDRCVSGLIKVDGRQVCPDSALVPGETTGDCFYVSWVTRKSLIFQVSGQVYEWSRR